MNQIINILAESAADSADAEMRLAIYTLGEMEIYKKVGLDFLRNETNYNEQEWGLLTLATTLGYISEFIHKRLTEKQRHTLFEQCFDTAVLWYFKKTGASNPEKMAASVRRAIHLEEPQLFFKIGQTACDKNYGISRHLVTAFATKYNTGNKD